MAVSAPMLGTCFKVDDVQELSKLKSRDVPERYISPAEETIGFNTKSSPPDLHVPLIDMANIFSSHHSTRQLEMDKLGRACREWGFFQVLNHEIEVELLEMTKKVAREFFKLPLEEKEKYEMVPGTIQGYGHAFIFSEDQKLDWCDMMALGIRPNALRNENVWPEKPIEFRDTVEAYSMEVAKLCSKLLSAMAENLGLRSTIFEEMFGEKFEGMRMNFYPPCPRPDLVVGLSAHSDGSALTALLQDDHCVGLQVLHQNQWISVEPIPGALIIVIGDTMEVLTNGEYKSIEHRAVTNKDMERLSIVIFHSPNYEVELGPLAELIDEDHPRKYRNYKHAEYSNHYIAKKLNGKRSLDFARI